MQRVLRSTVIETSAELVWSLVRDFNAHEQWHPAIDAIQIERAEVAERVGCVRRFRLADGRELREQLLSLSDLEMSYSYCLLDTPIPLFNYVAHFRVIPVTDTDHAYCEWEGQFDTRAGEEAAMIKLVGDDIYMSGFRALQAHFNNEVQSA